MKPGPKMEFGHIWTKTESRALKEAYAAGGLDAARKALPHRSDMALRQRARALRVIRCRWWSPQEDTSLRERWGIDSIRVIAKAHQRSVHAVWRRARSLGLETCPQGLVFVGDAAIRAGYCRAELQRILRWAGVRTLPAFSSNTGHRIKQRVVDPFDADEAVKKWLATETLSAAARRVGVNPDKIERLALEMGVSLGKRTSRAERSHYRVNSQVIDDLIATYRSKETIAQACTRHRMSRWTLLGILRSREDAPKPVARPGKGGRHVWRLDPAYVDRVVREMKEK